MGFDNECILNIQSLAGEYFCPVCRLLVYPNEALQSQCTHLYCKPCLAYVANTTRACPYDGYLVTEADSKPLAESNKALAETINKIPVHCLYHRSGCTWQGPLSDCVTHCSGCAFGNSPVVCNRCGIQIVHRQVQEHAQSCPGVQSQAPQAAPSHESAATSVATTNSQVSKPAEQASSQAQTAKPVNETALPTPEQWYQQQYQQYYQQYAAAYGTNNPQHLQYYPNQQQPEAVQPQHSQPQLQPSIPPQPPHQVPVLSQPQPQAQVQPQPQVPLQPQAQSQVPAAAVALPQQQIQPGVLSYPQHNMQTHQLNTTNPQSLQHSQQLPTQTTTAPQHPQTPVHQLPPHPQPVPLSHVQSHPQPQPGGPVPHPLPNPPVNALPQLQVQPGYAVPGYQSYPPSQPSSQLQLGGSQQHPVPMRPPQQVQGQGLATDSSLPVRPPLAQAAVFSQQTPGLGQPPSRSMNFPPAQQALYPNTQQPGQPIQQHLSQANLQQQQPPFAGVQLGITQSQLYQQGPFPQPQMPVRPQMRPHFPTPSRPPQPQQSLQHPHPSQNLFGRPSLPSHGVLPGVVQVRPAQRSFNPHNIPNNQVQPTIQQGGSMPERSVTNKQAGLSSQNSTRMEENSVGDNVSKKSAVKSEKDTEPHAANHKESENQEVAKKQVAKEETAQSGVEPLDAKSGKENQDGPQVHQNEILEKGIEKDTSLVLGPSGREKIPASVHGTDGYKIIFPAGQNPAPGVVRPSLQPSAAAPSGLPMNVGPQHKFHSEGQALDQFEPRGYGNLQQRQFNPHEHVLSSFTKQPFEREQNQFQHQSAPDQAPHDQGHLHQRMSLREEIPLVALDKSGGMFKHSLNPMGAEKLPDRALFYMDGRQPDPNLHGAQEQASWGHQPRMNRPPGVGSPSFFDRDHRFKSFRDEHMHASSVNLSRHVYDENELKRLRDPIAKYGNPYSSGGRFDRDHFEKAVHGFTPDGAGSTSSRMLPPYDHDVVLGKRPFSPPRDNIERLNSSRLRPDIQGSLPGYTRHQIEGSIIRSPGEYGGLPSRGLGVRPTSRGSLGPDDIVRRESHFFGDPIGRSFPGSRFQDLPEHIRKSELGPGVVGIGQHLRNGDLMGRDLLSHAGRGELLGPQNLRRGETGGVGPFHLRVPAGEIGHEAYGGQLGSTGKERFGDLRRRTVTGMCWCRICKVDCETVEELDLHSQTREHQKVAMDIVRSIKYQNAKKQKINSGDKSSVEDRSRLKTPITEFHGRKQ